MKKILPLVNNFIYNFKIKKKDQIIRDINELFNDGTVFDASDKELNNALRVLSNDNEQNVTTRNKNLIRTFIINEVKNQRHIDKIDARNAYLTVLIIILTVVNIFLSYRQYINSQIQTQSISAQNEIGAERTCLNNPNGNWPDIWGNPIKCTEVLKMIKK